MATSWFGLLRQSADRWLGDNAMRLAAALAFYSILSLAPLAVVAVAIAGAVFDAGAAREELVRQVQALVGSAGADVVRDALAHSQLGGAGALASILGVGTLLVGAAGVCVELRAALNEIWRVPPRETTLSRFVAAQLFAFGMVLAVGFLLLVSLIGSAALSGLSDRLSALFVGAPWLFRLISFAISWAAAAALFAVMFRFLPETRTPWRSAIVGGAITSLLFYLGQYVIGVYIAHAALGSTFGAAGSLVVLVVWIYYSASIFLFGAELTALHAANRTDSAAELRDRTR